MQIIVKFALLRLIGKRVVDFLLVIIHAVTDGQTDTFAIGRTVLHTMQRGKNVGVQKFKNLVTATS